MALSPNNGYLCQITPSELLAYFISFEPQAISVSGFAKKVLFHHRREIRRPSAEEKTEDRPRSRA
jgi:hypothetical protein